MARRAHTGTMGRIPQQPHMKQSTSFSWLTNRCVPFLSWWQELILNWVASWSTISTLIIISSDGEDQCEWDLPTDTELKRLELEELMGRCDT